MSTLCLLCLFLRGVLSNLDDAAAAEIPFAFLQTLPFLIVMLSMFAPLLCSAWCRIAELYLQPCNESFHMIAYCLDIVGDKNFLVIHFAHRCRIIPGQLYDFCVTASIWNPNDYQRGLTFCRGMQYCS